MLAHLHHHPRLRPQPHHHWARDAVIAAQIGAAALIVVTALERGRNEESAPAADHVPATELVATADQATPSRSVTTVVANRSGADSSAAADATGAPSGATTATDAAAAATVGFAGQSTAPSTELGAATEASGAAVVLGADAATGAGRIEIAVLHADATAAPVVPRADVLLGPLTVKVLDQSDATVAEMTVAVGDIGRIENLAPGPYRLVLSSTSGVSEPSPDTGISAANMQITDTINVAEGDVLLIAAQPNAALPNPAPAGAG